MVCEVHVLLHFIFTFYPTFLKEALIDLNIRERKLLQANIWPKNPLSLIHFSCRFSICLHPTMENFKTFDKFQVFFFLSTITFFNCSNLSNANNTFPLMLNGNAFKIITIVESLPMPLCLVFAKGK